ncbi:MAG: MATE family efflux transporter [Ruminococcus sp.]|uniref:MATE family efflux transporter n=1 Tax=Ruminococcus sp. TaxID=41978 RepID=UPI0025D1D30F|nr:MATE family efflux transporter [Ruminococcus sp.]MBR0530291.1 MATE family efflux transporter [Ruminococcus sp.]
MTTDMTKGSTLKNILTFCLPMTAGSLFQQLYNMVDSIIVGQYVGVEAFSAVGLVGSVMFLVIGTAVGMCSGFSIPIAQRFGAEDYKGMRKTLYNAVILAGIIALVLTSVTTVLAGDLLKIMSTPDELFSHAYNYLFVIFLGIPVTIFYNLLCSVLRALGDSKTPLRYLLISSVLNVILDIALIVGFKLGVAGAAIATVASQLIAGLLCLRHMIRNVAVITMEADEKKIDGRLMVNIFTIGMPMAFQFSITAVGSIILQTAVNKLGANSVAAMAAGQKIQNFIAQPMDTLGVTIATFGGQNLGAGRFDRIHKGAREVLAAEVIYAVLIGVFVFFFGDVLAQIFIKKDSEDYLLILENMRHFLRVTCLFYPVLGVLFLFRSLLQGLGFSAVTMLAGCMELVARCVVAFGFISRYGFNAAVFASPIAWAAAALLLSILYGFMIRKAERRLSAKPVPAAAQ